MLRVTGRQLPEVISKRASLAGHNKRSLVGGGSDSVKCGTMRNC